jgi:hypothetical protein
VRPLAQEDEWTAELSERLAQDPPAGQERFMLLICSDGVPTDAKRETMQRELPRWIERMAAGKTLVAGSQLAAPGDAVTVRVRGPHTLVSDGPFVETKEFVAGFDVVDCASLDDAVAVAAAHPVSWFHTIEAETSEALLAG